jgi:hypothetical protein
MCRYNGRASVLLLLGHTALRPREEGERDAAAVHQFSGVHLSAWRTAFLEDARCSVLDRDRALAVSNPSAGSKHYSIVLTMKLFLGRMITKTSDAESRESVDPMTCFVHVNFI